MPPPPDDCGCRPTATLAKGDRYVTFLDLDCNGRAARVMAHIDQLLAQPGRGGPFWDYFQNKRQPRSGPPPDDLLLIHTHLNQVRELFEGCSDEPGLALLDDLEQTCC